jgi:3-oxoacyl-[acyl-carrier-protein] synthase II
MGGAGALELAGNLPAFEDHMVHNCLNVDELDPECELPNLVIDAPVKAERMEYILNNSFGMMGINSVVIVKKHHP